MRRNANDTAAALTPVVEGGLALLAEARARLADERICAGIEAAGRMSLVVLLLDLSSALMLLRAVAEGDMAPARAIAEALRLDLPGQTAATLTPALRGAQAPALQGMLLQVASLAAQVLSLLDALADPQPDVAVVPRGAAQKNKPRQRPSGRPRLHLVPLDKDA